MSDVATDAGIVATETLLMVVTVVAATAGLMVLCGWESVRATQRNIGVVDALIFLSLNAAHTVIREHTGWCVSVDPLYHLLRWLDVVPIKHCLYLGVMFPVVLVVQSALGHMQEQSETHAALARMSRDDRRAFQKACVKAEKKRRRRKGD